MQQQKLGGYGGDVEDPGGVSPTGGHTNYGDDGETCGGQEVGIFPGAYRSTFREVRLTSRHRWNADPFMRSLSRWSDDEMVGS